MHHIRKTFHFYSPVSRLLLLSLSVSPHLTLDAELMFVRIIFHCLSFRLLSYYRLLFKLSSANWSAPLSLTGLVFLHSLGTELVVSHIIVDLLSFSHSCLHFLAHFCQQYFHFFSLSLLRLLSHLWSRAGGWPNACQRHPINVLWDASETSATSMSTS